MIKIFAIIGVAVTLIVVAILVLFFTKKGIELIYRWCPQCGARLIFSEEHLLIGGNCSFGCPKCSAGIICNDSHTGEIRDDSVPINIFQALWLKIRRIK